MNAKARATAYWNGLSPQTRSRLRSGGLGFALGFVFAAWLFLRSGEKPPELQKVEATSGGVQHPAIKARPVLVKAVIEPKPGRLLKYRWDYGDGSDPVEGIVTNPYAVSASHAYPEAEVGTEYTARLTVTDSESGDAIDADYRIKFVEPTVDNKATIALANKLARIIWAVWREDEAVYVPYPQAA